MFPMDIAQTLGKVKAEAFLHGGRKMRVPDFRYTGVDHVSVIAQTDIKDLKRALFWRTHALAENRFCTDSGGTYLKLQYGRN